MVILVWCLTALLLAIWSLGGWGLHTLLTLGPSWVDQLPPLIAQLPYPAVLERWLPNWRELLLAAAAMMQVGFGWLGSAGVVVVWVLWAFGALLLLALAALLTFALRKVPAPRPPAATT
jgi:hypothetical protein